MKTSGGKEILLVLFFCFDTARNQETAKYGLQMGLRRRRMGPNEIEPVGMKKQITLQRTKPFLLLMCQTLLMN